MPLLAGWSLGGGVLWQYALDYPDDLASLTMVVPLSPYGFGGTKGAGGEPCFADFAATGGGRPRRRCTGVSPRRTGPRTSR